MEGQTGFLAKREPGEFAERLELMPARDELSVRLGKVACEWVLERWRWEHVLG